jgi:uncharacterized protein YndB with AHSA1/START domain
MDIDVTRHIGAIARHVATRMHEGKPARVATITRTYATTPADLWEAFTSAERIPRWFLPITGNLELGGRYQLQGNAGGTILECEPPRHLKITWEYSGETSWVDVRLAPDGDGTRLTLEHVAFVKDEWWDQYGPGATGVGWDLAFIGLMHHVETGAMKSADAGMQWMMSENGKAFIRASSEAWARASIADGTDAAAATAAGDRTTAFYTGG